MTNPCSLMNRPREELQVEVAASVAVDAQGHAGDEHGQGGDQELGAGWTGGRGGHGFGGMIPELEAER